MSQAGGSGGQAEQLVKALRQIPMDELRAQVCVIAYGLFVRFSFVSKVLCELLLAPRQEKNSARNDVSNKMWAEMLTFMQT